MIVQSTVKPKEIEIDEYLVWVNSDVHEITVEDKKGAHIEYEYNQIQYSKDEYIKLMSEQNKNLENEVTDTQLALCDLFEMIGG